MSIEAVLLSILIILSLCNLVLLLRKRGQDVPGLEQQLLNNFERLLNKIEMSLRDEFQRTRLENHAGSKAQRQELASTLNHHFNDFTRRQQEINKEAEQRIKEVKDSVEKQLREIRSDNEKQLDKMRETVDEKLQKTLNIRLAQSFETVGRQLQSVQKGLGEMKTLASDVGGLKKVLSNVKMRGGFGEIQLSMLLEQILAPSQYASNVQTKKGSKATVEFAVKLPGKTGENSVVWLPIDAKFPKDVYQKLQEAYEQDDPAIVQQAQRELDLTIKKMAKDISEKYIDPPNTTDFAILFLPFEGIYAEVVRKAALLETMQREYKIIITGPTTLAAILNSLQMGFKTFAIQKQSSVVWETLTEVKKEFGKFAVLIEKAQNNIKTGLNQLDDVMGVRTRAIQRKLDRVGRLEDPDQPGSKGF